MLIWSKRSASTTTYLFVGDSWFQQLFFGVNAEVCDISTVFKISSKVHFWHVLSVIESHVCVCAMLPSGMQRCGWARSQLWCLGRPGPTQAGGVSVSPTAGKPLHTLPPPGQTILETHHNHMTFPVFANLVFERHGSPSGLVNRLPGVSCSRKFQENGLNHASHWNCLRMTEF